MCVQRVAHAVLRGHLQLAADVVLDQVGEEFTVLVLEQDSQSESPSE